MSSVQTIPQSRVSFGGTTSFGSGQQGINQPAQRPGMCTISGCINPRWESHESTDPTRFPDVQSGPARRTSVIDPARPTQALAAAFLHSPHIHRSLYRVNYDPLHRIVIVAISFGYSSSCHPDIRSELRLRWSDIRAACS